MRWGISTKPPGAAALGGTPWQILEHKTKTWLEKTFLSVWKKVSQLLTVMNF